MDYQGVRNHFAIDVEHGIKVYAENELGHATTVDRRDIWPKIVQKHLQLWLTK